jgi:hypothetical protein
MPHAYTVENNGDLQIAPMPINIVHENVTMQLIALRTRIESVLPVALYLRPSPQRTNIVRGSATMKIEICPLARSIGTGKVGKTGTEIVQSRSSGGLLYMIEIITHVRSVIARKICELTTFMPGPFMRR